MNEAARFGDFAAALLDPARPAPAELRCWNGSNAAMRFAVHRNNVVVSLIDALAESFPVVRALVGEKFFAAMAARFVRRFPPRSPVLAFYGETFADFVADFEPARPVPYLADMARLEHERVRAFHAADAESLTPPELARAIDCGESAGDWAAELQPSLAAIDSAFAVASIWAAHQDGSDLGAIDPRQPESMLVLRDGLVVLVRQVGRGVTTFVRALQQRLPIAPAAGEAAAADAGFDLQQAFALLVEHHSVLSLIPAEEGG